MHSKYYNSKHEEVPSVTTVMKLLYKDGLLEWSNYIGKRGIDYTKFMEEKANLGTAVHEWLEADLEHRKSLILGTETFLKEVEDIASSFSVVKDALKINNVRTEISLSSERFGGTCDLLCDLMINGDPARCLCDFKTSKAVYTTQFIQLGGYLLLLKENEPDEYEKIKYCMIFSITKNKVKIKWITKEDCEKYFSNFFLKLVDVYYAWKEINFLFDKMSISRSY